MTTAEILRAAAQRVRQGWCQGYLLYGDDVCAAGAISQVLGTDEGVVEIARTAARLLGLSDKKTISALVMWNDAPEQTAENVAQGFELVAILWEQEQAQRTERVLAEQVVS